MNKKMETVGDILKKKRIQLGKHLSSISLDTRIDVKKLKALEENNFSVFESPVSTKGFIKIYAEYLNLNCEKILAIYRRDFGEKRQDKEILSNKKEEKSFSWKYIYITIPIILLLVTVVYLYNQFSHFQNPPILEIFEPKNNSTVNEETVTIRGRTERDTIIDIGDTKVPVDENGEFTTTISTQPGDNILTIRATNSRNPSRESIEIIHITYEPVEEEEVEEEKDVIDEIVLILTVENAPTWIEIIVDDQLIVSQILQVGYSEEFTAKRNVSVNTGILQNTKVEINGDRRMLSQEDLSVRCEIIDKELSCK